MLVNKRIDWTCCIGIERSIMYSMSPYWKGIMLIQKNPVRRLAQRLSTAKRSTKWKLSWITGRSNRVGGKGKNT